MSSVFGPVMIALIVTVPVPASPSPADSCPGLAQLALTQAKVTSAATVAAGDFSPPADLSPRLRGESSLYKALPRFCRVALVATPSADSAIEIEVWMPVDAWNGKFRGQGNGGFAGEIDYRAMASAVRQGYATAGTNTGHSGKGTNVSWALGHPEKLTDFGYRAIHVMTDVAKTAIQAYHGRSPRYSYFASCSNGGRQALMEVQRFPGDYDGVLAGAPAHHFTHLLTKALADAQATTLDPASYIPPSKLPAIAKAVDGACDARDGVTDGVVGDPPACPFDPTTLLCREGDSEGCLTAPQVVALRGLYAGLRDSKGQRIYPGYLPGAEMGNGGWGLWLTGPSPGKSLTFAFQSGFFSNIVYEKPDWDYRTANVRQALAAAEAKTSRTLDAVDPNLSEFKAQGGKLILYHGWNDAGIPALSTLEYYDRVVSRLGEQETDAFLRLYMVPGMQHCDGGPGPSSFGQDGAGLADDPRRDVLLALERWVEAGTAPSAIIATKYLDNDPAKGVKATRPLCPHPQVAKYKGQGDPNEATSFACASARP